MDFSDPRLLKIYGTWVKVQVAFYDFIMKIGLDRADLTEDDINDFRYETKAYDIMVARCADFFETPEVAWTLFLKNEGVSLDKKIT